MAKDIFGAIGEPMPLFEVQALLDDPPAWMTDRMKSRLARFASTYQARVREAQKQRHADTVRTIKETGSDIRKNIDAHERKVEEVHAAVQHGRMDPAEARQELSETFRQIKSLRERLAGIDKSEADAWAMVSTDPEVYQIERMERFPVLADALPRLSPDWLRGDDDTDPFRGAQ